MALSYTAQVISDKIVPAFDCNEFDFLAATAVTEMTVNDFASKKERKKIHIV